MNRSLLVVITRKDRDPERAYKRAKNDLMCAARKLARQQEEKGNPHAAKAILYHAEYAVKVANGLYYVGDMNS